MNYIPVFALAFTLIFSSNTYAQTKGKAKTAATTAKPEPVYNIPILKTQADSASYAFGMNMAQSMNRDLGNMNTDLIMRGMQDVFGKKTTLFTEEASYDILMRYSTKVREEKMKEDEAKTQKAIDEGTAFLQQNKTKAGVKTTASGLQYEVIKEGSGTKPTAADTVTVHYRGTLIDGSQFDASYDRNEPLTLALGSVIAGWTEGVQLMSVGSKYKLFIPYELGYGMRGVPPAIPGGSTLIFEIELLAVRPTLSK